jgi:hypothetical protein
LPFKELYSAFVRQTALVEDTFYSRHGFPALSA